MKQITITTDGACYPNPGNGAWAALLRFGSAVKEMTGREPRTTNNKMEFRAMIEALKVLKEPCEVLLRTDSRVAISWSSPSAFSKEKKRISDPVVWGMIQEYREHSKKHKITTLWVKGHAGDSDNERCDQLAEDQSKRPF